VQRVNGGWTVSNDQALAIANWTAITYDAGSGDGTVAATLVNGSTVSLGYLVFRYVDDGDYWIWGRANGDYQLGYFAGHNYYLISDTGLSARDGDVLQVVLSGSSITATVNGTTWAAPSNSTFQTATSHGLGCGPGVACLFDDFSYSPTLASTGPLSTSGVAFSDNFNRPDGGMSGPWTQQMSGGWVVSNQQAVGNNSNWTAMTNGTGSANGTVQATLVDGAEANMAWIVFRYQDGGDYWIWGKDGNTYQLGYFFGHNYYLLAETGLAAQDGDVLQVVMNGNTITATVNGVTRASATNNAFATLKAHGLGCGPGACTFDDFSYVPTLASTGPVSTTGVAFADNFNRDNSPIGGPWVQHLATGWTVNNQQAQAPASNWSMLTYSAGSPDGTITATLTNASAMGGTWLAFRYMDIGDYWIFGKINGDYQLGYWSNHAYVLAVDTGLTASSGDVVQVVMHGNSLAATVNGATVAMATDSTFATSTAHGLGCDPEVCLFDDFSYSPTLAPTSNVTVQAAATVMQQAYKPYGTSGGDPVQTFTGNFGYSHSDLAIPGRGPSPVLLRTANSGDTRTGQFGPGWTSNYGMHLASPGDGTADLYLVGPQGGADRYSFHNGGTFSPPPAVYATLVRNPDGSYTATQKDQSAWTFDSTGKLTRISDRYGNASVLTYNPQFQLVSVSDPAGRGNLSFAYNASGLLASVTDWASPARSVQYGYDASGRLQTVTDRDGKQTTYAYDGTSSRLTAITDANNHTAITLSYDGNGRVQSQQDALGNQTSFAYVTNGDGTQTTTVTLPTTSYQPSFHPTTADTYDTSGRLIKRLSQPSSAETYTQTFSYDSNSNLASSTDARGNTTQFCYDVDYTGAAIAGSAGNLTRTIAPAPAAGQNVLVSLLTYDSKNNVLETVSPKGVASGASASCSTNFASSINALYATDNAYDGSGVDLLSTTQRYTDPDLGQQTAITKYEYNDSANPGRLTRLIPPRGNTGGTPDYSYATTMTYYGAGSQAGMLQSSTDADGNQTTYSYDAVGRKVSMVDPDGNAAGGTPAAHTWSWSYDNEDRLLSVSAPAPTTGGSPLLTQYQYDPVGNRTVVIDANGQVTKDSYDVRDNLSQVDQSPSPWTNPNVTPSPDVATSYSYDNLGKLSRVTRAKGDSANERATDYLYDGAGRLRQEIQYPSWPATTPTLVTSSSYDGNGNQTSRADPLNQTATFGYDALNRLTAIGYSDGKTPNVSYAYDANGNRRNMTDGTGITTYSVDELGRLTAVSSPGSVSVGYRYDLNGNATKLIYPDNTAVTSSYDKANRLTGLADWASRSTSYGYFPDGGLQTVTNVDGTTATYSEDNAQRLTQVSNQQGSSVIDQHSYTLDSLGNPTQRSETLAKVSGGSSASSTTYSYDSLYRLLGDGTTSYAYDPVGNRSTLTVGGVPTASTYDRADRVLTAGTTVYSVNAAGNVTVRGTDSFAYDQANRLTSATVGGVTTTAVYNGDGQRSSQAVGTNPTTTYVYDSNRGLPVVLTDGTLKYVYGAQGLAYSVDATNNVSVYHIDGLGSVRTLTNGSGTLMQTYQTDAFGNVTASQGTSSQPFGFTGQQQDSTGLLYLRARYHESATGRFLSRDPVFGLIAAPLTLNRYSYMESDPLALN